MRLRVAVSFGSDYLCTHAIYKQALLKFLAISGRLELQVYLKAHVQIKFCVKTHAITDHRKHVQV